MVLKMALHDLHCMCGTGHVERLTSEGIESLLDRVQGWQVVDNHHLFK